MTLADARLMRQTENMRLFPIVDHLPPGFDGLREAARGEGFEHIERLVQDWASGTQRFSGDGELLLAAESQGILAGIGGLTIEAALPETLRLRRFYVLVRFRGAGIGRAIALCLIDHARARGQGLTLNALTPEACAFWEKLGFIKDARLGFSHRMNV